MRTILEELFYGNICPNTDCRSHDKETKQLMGYIADHHDNLLSTLNDQQKELLEKFDAECLGESIETDKENIPISIAKGFARYDSKKDSNFIDVFNRADDAMYENKREMKGLK